MRLNQHARALPGDRLRRMIQAVELQCHQIFLWLSIGHAPAEFDNQQRARILTVLSLGESDMTRAQISEFCIISLAHVLRVPKETVEADAVFNRLGLDSAMVVYLMMELEEKLDLELSPDDFYDYPTVNALSCYLTERHATRSAA